MENFHKAIKKWSEIIYDKKSDFFLDSNNTPEKYVESLIYENADFLFNEMEKRSDQFISPFSLGGNFGSLIEDERHVWFKMAADIPFKLASLNLLIRPFKEFCRTCIITEDEVETLARADHAYYLKKSSSMGWNYGNKFNEVQKTNPSIFPFHKLLPNQKRYYLELNYLLPVLLRNNGFEIIRTEEVAGITNNLILKLARAIHSRYALELRKIVKNEDTKRSAMTWDNLPEDIRYSNMDNAWHIPTKLLAIGYKIRPVSEGYRKAALSLDDKQIETMSRVEHIRWCWDKRLAGWMYGTEINRELKLHPSLISYDLLSEQEKDKDRHLVRLIPALLQDINYEAYPINLGGSRKLPYAIKPDSSIHRLLSKTREMNSEIARLTPASHDIEERLWAINKKIEETINEVRSSYNYAQYIQEAFLPDDLFVRECFPESFVMYKPKDIVSGDFYYFNRQEDIIVFAAADCTGHGIPGALLSTIGYGIIDQAVNELKLIEPHLILEHLYSRIHRFLRHDDEGSCVSDDMDIVLCTLDIGTKLLKYSDVGNPIYRVTNGELVSYRTRNQSKERDENDNYNFATKEIELLDGDTIYLGSDGYADQFGGGQHKKFMSSRLRTFLMSIQYLLMHEQCDRLYEEIERWREEGDEEQTDDILLIGIKV